ncbi:hypothetical protein F5B17DRAFT_418132 [Nemania serpens]|nr:hypothetical protein F5B17DRAFT_418132 [Nemania serpens]
MDVITTCIHVVAGQMAVVTWTESLVSTLNTHHFSRSTIHHLSTAIITPVQLSSLYYNYYLLLLRLCTIHYYHYSAITVTIPQLSYRYSLLIQSARPFTKHVSKPLSILSHGRCQ